MPTYSPDPKGLKMVRCDACQQDVAALEAAEPLATPGLTAQQVMQAHPQVAAEVFRHEKDCPATRPPADATPASPAAGPWQRFVREGRWSVALLLVGLGLFAGSLLLGPDAEPGGLADRVVFPLCLWVGGALAIIGAWWTARALAKMGG
jgi:hypothetical protein